MCLGRAPCIAAGNDSNTLGKMEDIKEFVQSEMLMVYLKSHQGFQICWYRGEQESLRPHSHPLDVLLINNFFNQRDR